ncbi:MAG: MoxR family ATPase [Planctomycetota bacterium]
MASNRATFPDVSGRHPFNVEDVCQRVALARRGLGRVVVGLEEASEQLFTSLLCDGHCILQGGPGAGKTKLVSTIASLMDLTFQEVQSELDPRVHEFVRTDAIDRPFVDSARGLDVPRRVANVVMVNQVHRDVGSTRKSILDSMWMHESLSSSSGHAVRTPLCIIATQGPFVGEGTFTTDVLDRFLMKIVLADPSEQDEHEIVRRACEPRIGRLHPVVNVQQFMQMREAVERIHTSDYVIDCATRIARSTRFGSGQLKQGLVRCGAGPRASIDLVKAARARAAIRGRARVEIDDLKAVAKPVLRHRIVLSDTALAKGLCADQLLEKILGALKTESIEQQPWDGGHFI